MTKTSYRQALKDARVELRRLFQEREKLERRIVKTKQSVLALQRMTDETHTGEFLSDIAERRVGLTDAVRSVLMASTRPLAPLDIRNKLEGIGYDIGTSPNVLNSVHTVVRRLRDSGEVKQVGRKADSKWAKEKGYRFTAIGYWWGEYGLPAGWTVYPDKRLQKEWKRKGIVFEDDPKEEDAE